MLLHKPTFESITPDFGNSFTYQRFDEHHINDNSLWHYHPEIELVYVNGGTGRRQVGSNLSYYTWGTLILVGSNLPHCGFTDELTGNKSETVIHMKADYLGDTFFNLPETAAIKRLLQVAQRGIVFSGETKKRVGAMMESMEGQSDFTRLMTQITVLNELATTKEFRILNADGFSLLSDVKDNNRINEVFNYVKTHFKEEIPLEEMASITNLTIPSFCRYFKKITHKTFTQFVNEYRLVHASRLLAEQPMSITQVCYESGFNNFSHFNKKFKAFTGQNPSDYRKELKTVLE
ncbi:AraC family transcriptional regulator [uncultured Dokdonia sp.]|jgi:AraC-like DNA-binding protein|uniref:AraC family transcriptional regulator n=1 Tax=Dokdonia sp. R78006 TaxID=3093866 RepID=UPI0026363E89|nr:AraC family transcriptional regulator [uncultured Dokdonia sp.]|tara:strand:- start:24406 stop:25278 length:873 start_codon:yes stop_codon:yes gene_type:complete